MIATRTRLYFIFNNLVFVIALMNESTIIKYLYGNQYNQSANCDLISNQTMNSIQNITRFLL